MNTKNNYNLASHTVKNKKKNGFIHIIIIFVMAIIIISLLGVDLNNLIKNQNLKNNFKIVWDAIKDVWNKYLINPSQIVWNFFIIYIWTPVKEKIK